jgi:hypothetical protein
MPKSKQEIIEAILKSLDKILQEAINIIINHIKVKVYPKVLDKLGN